MKLIRSTLILIVLLTVMLMFSAISSDAATCNLKAQVTGSNVNVRKSASSSGKILTTIPKKNTNVTLLNTTLYNKSWYRIKLNNGKKGYINSDFIKIKSNQLFIASKKTGYVGYKGSYSVINTTSAKVKWLSSDKSIAKVTSKGVITYLKEGSVDIVANAGKKTSKSKLTVKSATVSVETTPTELIVGDTYTLKVSCVKPITFKSSDYNIATVDKNGVITAVSPGEVSITVSSKSDSVSFTINVEKRILKLTTSKTTLFTGCHSTIKASGGLEKYKYKSSDNNVLTVTNSGLITAVGKGTAKITCTSGDIKGSKKFIVKNGTAVNISNKQATVSQGMTLYLKSSTNNVKWSSSDTSIATVTNGYVMGIKKGTAVITAYTSSGASDCIVTVNRAEAVRFVYTSENSAFVGDDVTFYAITDNKRKFVKFEITSPNGDISTISDTDKTTIDGRYIWSAVHKLTEAGEYKFSAYSKTSETANWLTDPSAQGTTFASNVANKKTVAYSERRASSELINIIAEHEGFAGYVYTDTLANNIPTVGYGRVIYAGSTFYNGMTQKEAFAFLVKTVNESGYTSRMNKILTENKIKFSQQHFDALVDFSYNLGPYCITNNDSLFNVLLNSYGSESNDKKAFVNCFDAVVKESASDSSKIIKKLSAGVEITLVSAKSDYYKIKLDSNSFGYILKSSVTRRTTDTKVRNLNNVKLKNFAKAYLPYHHASGTCYKGLLYRRVDEVETFFFGDYMRDGKSNKAGLSYKCSNNSGFYI